MYVNVVLDIREGVLDGLLVLLNICNVLLYFCFSHFGYRHEEVCEELELRLELVLLPNLVSGGIEMLNASLNGAQDHGLKWSRLYIFVMIELI